VTPRRPAYAPGAHLTNDVEAIRRSLETFAQVNGELTELFRAGGRLGLSQREMTRLAAVDRSRVRRALLSQPDVDPEATTETAEELAKNVRDGAYVLAAEVDGVALESRTILGDGLADHEVAEILRDGEAIGWVVRTRASGNAYVVTASARPGGHVVLSARGAVVADALRRLAEQIADAERG
jgi:hypothetical protein